MTCSSASPLDADDLGELALLRRQLRVEQQAGHPDDGVHRRPDLVAHRREEGALRARRRLRLLARPLELGDVARLVDRGGRERGERLRHPRVLGRVEVGLETVERQHPDQAVADEQGDGHPSPDVPLAEGVLEMRVSVTDVRDDQGLVPLDQFMGRIVDSPPVVADSDQLVEVRIALTPDDHQLVAVELLEARTLIGHHLAELRQDQIEDLLHPHGAAERMGRRP